MTKEAETKLGQGRRPMAYSPDITRTAKLILGARTEEERSRALAVFSEVIDFEAGRIAEALLRRAGVK